MTSTFLALNEDCRHEIYTHVLRVPGAIEFIPISDHEIMTAKNMSSFHDHYWKQIAPLTQFLRTCKAIYEEACPIFYGNNRFRFSGEQGWIALWLFTAKIGERNSSFLRQISVPSPWLNETYGCMSLMTRRSELLHAYSQFGYDAHFKSASRHLKWCDAFQNLFLEGEELGYSVRAMSLVCESFARSKTLQTLELVLPSYYCTWISTIALEDDEKHGLAAAVSNPDWKVNSQLDLLERYVEPWILLQRLATGRSKDGPSLTIRLTILANPREKILHDALQEDIETIRTQTTESGWHFGIVPIETYNEEIVLGPEIKSWYKWLDGEEKIINTDGQ
ncbi:hypothetical protein BT63DRAFT_463950 [Microthyrium microscopicum]|uniref:Uncharacterized protein n=1 Tax=Microthyrium microscopicum TaxID=703497 RepID=A0A6A6U0D1_9PEZI|nr:hypothetical protein BT63DRAFT_463950 [Microthyrium microscopicum]